MKQAFTTALLAAAAAASAADADQPGYVNIQKDHLHLNDHYDNGDKTHHHYSGKGAASPARPSVPGIGEAVKAFNTYGTLFGEHRYQLQVAKTGEMLVGTEALREAISGLQDRVYATKNYAK